MDRHFDPYKRSYASLSVRDLLEARELYHVHLAHLTNVHATAVGFYRIRNDAPDHKKATDGEVAAKSHGHGGARRLDNSSTQPWSWPCVMVFVDRWLTAEEIRAARGLAIPPFLYMPDGRVIPVCTIEAPRNVVGIQSAVDYRYSSHLLGGGCPIVSDVQGNLHMGTVACLVTDGSRHYALTNLHVTGETGREIYASIDGSLSPVGVASRAVGRVLASKLFEGYQCKQTLSNLDAGLVDLYAIDEWTAQIFGLGVLGRMISFDAATATLDWIRRQVVAHGAHAGRMEGEINALFYRYRSVAGQDSMTDFLISGRDGQSLPTLPGDSGTLWCMDPTEYGEDPKSASARYRPVAMQWGGQRLQAGETPTSFALGSSLSLICRELEVDVVTDLREQLPQYWGATGHYKIAQLAIDSIKSPVLRTFMKAHLERISYSSETIAGGVHGEDPTKFVPLADVPDYVWKTNMNRKKPKVARAQENWNHYCDIDLPGKDGKSLDQLAGKNFNLDVQQWIDFYRTAPQPRDSTSQAHVNMGALPFRVWQVFDALVGYRKAGKKKEFLCAAGILAHYVGDACQPLHGSMHSDGLFGASTGVHGAYEEKMIDLKAPDIARELDTFNLSTLIKPKVTAISNGHEAAQATLDLMRRARTYLPPEEICRVHQKAGGGGSAKVIKALWTDLGPATLKCLADGQRTLAQLWDAAYATKKGANFTGNVSEAELKTIYEKLEFLKSLHLANMDPKVFAVP